MEDNTCCLKLGLLLLLSLSQSAAKCKFPREWKGRWYQGGLGEVTIKANSINPKGVCIEHHRDYFLVENKEGNCYQCLLMMKHHRNIIQYKESFCMNKDSLQTLCSQIRVEAILYTLVREPHFDVRCPFQDAYYFRYNDNMHGFCDNPISYAKPCAGESRFQFHFKHCVDAAMLNGQDMDFQCIATWKDGSDMFLYGKFSGPKISSKDDSFRCFKYKSYGSEVYMAMSADATCRGMRTYNDGPIVMEFTKDVFGWPQPACNFPNWFTAHDSWRDLSGRHFLENDFRKKGTMTLAVKKRPEAKEHVKSEIRCVEVLEQNETAKEFWSVSFTSSGCMSKHQCLWMKEMGPNVIEVKLGKLVDYAEAKKCLQSYDDFHDQYLLIPSSPVGTPCPLQGRYRVLYGSTDCPADLLSGCNQTSQMELDCSSQLQELNQVECIGSWQQGNSTHIIARPSDTDEQMPVGCLTLTEMEDVIEFSTDEHCLYNVPNQFPTPLSLSLHKAPGECESQAKGIYQKEGVVSEVDFINSHEGPYQHIDKNLKKTSRGGISKDVSSRSSSNVVNNLYFILLCEVLISLWPR